MFLNKKITLLIAWAIMALVTAEPGTVRNLKKRDTPKTPVKVTRVKGKEDKPDEVDLTLKMQTCEKESDECKKITGEDKVKKLSKKKFAKALADTMMGTLEDEDEGDRRLATLVCEWYYWCDCCWCYYYEACYYV